MKKGKQAKIRGNKNTTIWIVVLVVIIAIIGGYYYWNNYKAAPSEEGTPAASAPTIPETSVAPVAEEVTNEEFTFTEFPFVKTKELDEGRYSVSFESDNKIRFVVYSEDRYNEWLDSGVHTISKASTAEGVECCAENGDYTIDINEGESGTYYFVFDDEKGLGASQGKLIVNKVGEMS